MQDKREMKRSRARSQIATGAQFGSKKACHPAGPDAKDQGINKFISAATFLVGWVQNCGVTAVRVLTGPSAKARSTMPDDFGDFSISKNRDDEGHHLNAWMPTNTKPLYKNSALLQGHSAFGCK